MYFNKSPRDLVSEQQIYVSYMWKSSYAKKHSYGCEIFVTGTFIIKHKSSGTSNWSKLYK